jgi:hypothetical protein
MNSAVETEPASRPMLFIEPPGLDFRRASRFSFVACTLALLRDS